MVGRPQASIPVTVNPRPAVAGLRRVEGALGSLGSGLGRLTSIGAGAAAGLLAAGGAIAALSVRALVAADDIGKMGLRVGLAAGEVEQLRFAAEQSGASAKDMDTALTALSRRAAALPQNFQKWGIATRDVNGQLKPTSVLMRDVADRIQGAGSQAERLAIAQDLMSEAGRKLVPALQDGAAGLQAYADQASKLGLAIDNVESQSAARLGDRLNILSRQGTSLQRVLGSVLEPALSSISDGLSLVGGAAIRWLRTNRDMLRSGIAEWFGKLGGVLIPAVATGVTLVARAWVGWRLIVDGIRVAVNGYWAMLAKGFGWVLDKMERLARFAKQDGLADALARVREGAALAEDTFADNAEEARQGVLQTINGLRAFEREVEAFTVRAAMGWDTVTQGIYAYTEAVNEAPVAPGGGEGKTPEDAAKKGEAPIQRKTGNLLASYFETQQRMLDAQLENIELADQAMTKANERTVAYFVQNWEQGSLQISAALSNVGDAIGALGGNAKGAIAAQKGFAVAAIAINTAVAVSRAFAELGPIAGAVASVGLVAAGAASIARVLSTEPGGTGALGANTRVRTDGRTRRSPTAGAGAAPSGDVAPFATTIVNVQFNQPAGNPRRQAREVQRLATAGA